MSDAPHPSDHPYDTLAAYVDGSADPTEREAAESHLHVCDRCRRDVELASSGRAAVRSLTQVEAPAIAASVASTLGLEDSPRERDQDEAAVADLGQRRARRWQAVWGAGLAAAAIVAAVLIYVGVVSGGSPGGQGAAPAAAPPEAAGSVNPNSIDSLARDLAGGSGGASHVPAPAVTGVSRGEALTGASADVAETCVRSAGAVDPSADTTEIFTATFQGTPAYVGAFQTEGQVQVIVASRDGCQPLYTAAARTG
jgi:Putative zinc-finger